MQPEDARLRQIHAALVGALILALVAAGVVRELELFEPLAGAAPVLRLVAFVVLVTDLGMVVVLRARRPSIPDSDVAALRQHRLRTTFLSAALGEGIALTGTVFWMLTDDPLILFGVTGPGLLVLLVSRPGRDEEG